MVVEGAVQRVAPESLLGIQLAMRAIAYDLHYFKPHEDIQVALQP